MDEEQFKYWAFISYSHHDQKLAAWLHRKLETYRVPSNLTSRKSKTGEVPKRLYPVFRDREELPTSADLSNNIRSALRQSRFLIVVCSPHSAESLWVNEEIKIFKAMGREARVLCLIVEGEPNLSDKQGVSTKECFAPALRYRIDAKGRFTGERSEPIAADIRPGKDGKRNALLKLLAGLLGIDYAILNDREKRRRVKKQLAFASIAIVFIAAISAMIYLLLQQGQQKTLTIGSEVFRGKINYKENVIQYSSYVVSEVPNIDGIFTEGEWAEPAMRLPFNVYEKESNTQYPGEALFYYINDCDYLYAAMTLSSLDPGFISFDKEGIGFWCEVIFDADNNGYPIFGDDAKVLDSTKRYSTPDFTDRHVGPEGSILNDVKMDGAGAYGYIKNTSTYVYEFQIPLKSGDSQDLNIQPGDTIGVRWEMAAYQMSSGGDYNHIGGVEWPIWGVAPRGAWDDKGIPPPCRSLVLASGPESAALGASP